MEHFNCGKQLKLKLHNLTLKVSAEWDVQYCTYFPLLKGLHQDTVAPPSGLRR